MKLYEERIVLPEIKELELRDGIKLKLSLMEAGHSKWLIVTHGLGEHRQRYQFIYELFSQHFNICTYDLRGHGESTGKRAYIKDFNEFTRDLDQVLDFLELNYTMEKFSLFGHSMGGLITASFIQQNHKSKRYPEKVFLSSPAVAGAGPLGKVFELAPLKVLGALKSLPATLPVAGLLDLTKLSHDARVYHNYIHDSLNSLKIHTKLFFEILNHSKTVFSRPLRAKCDLFVSIGTEDYLVNPQSVIQYFEEVEKNAKLFKFSGAYHEIHNEIKKFQDDYFQKLSSSLLS